MEAKLTFRALVSGLDFIRDSISRSTFELHEVSSSFVEDVKSIANKFEAYDPGLINACSSLERAIDACILSKGAELFFADCPENTEEEFVTLTRELYTKAYSAITTFESELSDYFRV